MKSFASDNYAGALPEVIAAVIQANKNHAPSYGVDDICVRVEKMLSKQIGQAVSCHFVFNGTGANVFSLSLCTQSFHAIMCSDIAHIYADESSAPETFTGCRIFAINANEDGKISPEQLVGKLQRKGDMHYAQPAVVSITQPTEFGTVYTLNEIKAIHKFCKKNNLYLHMDGARLFNAQAALQCELSALLEYMDVVSFGGTKAGILYGECVVIINDELKKFASFKQKQVMQLPSKARFIAAQFEALLQNNLGYKAALQANTCASRLATGLSQIRGITITRKTQANGVFAIMPENWIKPLQEQFPFYVWDESVNEVRLMCSWDTRLEEVELFIKACAELNN